MASNISGDGYSASDTIAQDQALPAEAGLTAAEVEYLVRERAKGVIWATAVAALKAGRILKLQPSDAACTAWQPEVERRAALNPAYYPGTV